MADRLQENRMPVEHLTTDRLVTVLTGPTGVGKSSAAMAVADVLPVELISADSRQIFRGMDIGTDKPTEADRVRVRHHCVDICDPDELYNAGYFVRDARSAIPDILRRGRVPRSWPYALPRVARRCRQL